MKHLKQFAVAACIAGLACSAQAWYVKTITIFIEPAIQSASLTIFWAAMAAHGAIMVSEKAAEPLDKYEAGIWHSIRNTSMTTSWPDGDYPTRDTDIEQSYDYDPFTRVTRWWTKTTFSVVTRDGGVTSTVTYSQEPPAIPEFNVEDTHYKRYVMAGSHASDFAYDSYQMLTGYCIRRGSGAWGRPVTAWFKGWNYNLVVRSDIAYKSPTTLYEYGRHCFIGPSSLGTSSMALFKLKSGDPNAEVDTIAVVTLFFKPDEL